MNYDDYKTIRAFVLDMGNWQDDFEERTFLYEAAKAIYYTPAGCRLFIQDLIETFLIHEVNLLKELIYDSKQADDYYVKLALYRWGLKK